MPVAKEILLIKEVARALDDVVKDVVFVGGATTIFYIDDENALKPTPTDDIDLIVEITTYAQYAALTEKLFHLGFKKDIANPGPLCRFKLGEIDVDVMPVTENVLGFANSYYPEGFKNAVNVDADGVQVRIFSLPYFFASKLEAFNSRGKKGLLWDSQDLTDIVETLDGRTTAEAELFDAPEKVFKFIQREFKLLSLDGNMLEAMKGFLANYGPVTTARAKRVLEIMKRVSGVI